MDASQPINVLWTAGWDSTYRVADLMLRDHDAVVQPWYIEDPSRPSTRREKLTADRIRAALERKDPTVRERLLPTIVHRLNDIPLDGETTERWRTLVRRGVLGSQYDWLARLARWRDISLELCIHRDDKAHAFLEGELITDAHGDRRLAPTPTDPALRIFERFRFPIFDITKVEMQRIAEAKEFSDVMEMTWFCYVPLLDGRPCGFCNPCRYTREEGLGRRVPRASISRRAQHAVLSGAWAVRQRVSGVVRPATG